MRISKEEFEARVEEIANKIFVEVSDEEDQYGNPMRTDIHKINPTPRWKKRPKEQ